MRFLVIVHLVGDALLLWLGYYWLGAGEGNWSRLVWSALVAMLLLSLACCLHGGTLAYFGKAAAPGRGALGMLHRLGQFMAAVLILLAVYFLLARWADYSAQPAFKIASWLTLTFRKPVRPPTVLTIFNVALWLIRWVVVPVAALPVLSRIATGRWPARTILYWIEVPILLLCAVWLPLKLIGWVPTLEGFGLQMFSFVVRALIAYLLLVGAWLTLEFLTSGGKPRSTQPSTVALP
jgi:hypothetical protein